MSEGKDISAETLLTAVDAVSTLFDVVPADQRPTQVTLQSPDFPSLTKSLRQPRDWIPDSKFTKRASHVVYLDQVGYVGYAEKDRIRLWMESGGEEPVEYAYEDNITCLGTLMHERVDQLLMVCTKKKIDFIAFYVGTRHMKVNAGPSQDLEDIATIRQYGDGQALLGTSNGEIRKMVFSLENRLLVEGFITSISNITGECTHSLSKPSAIADILIDSERQLAYAVHTCGKLEVLSFEETEISDKPARVALYEQPDDEPATSFAVLPSSGFRDAVLVGATSTGRLYFFGLDRGVVVSRDMTPQDMAKRAKTWCGIGHKQNLNVVYDNSAVEVELEQFREEGCVSVLAVHQTCIYLSIHHIGDDTSTLWELKNAAENAQYLQEIKSVTLRGKLLDIYEQKQTRLSPARPLSLDRRLKTNELTAQFFCSSPCFTVTSNEQYQRIRRQWPSEVLSKILKQKNAPHLHAFVQIYSSAETTAMAIFLAMGGQEEAKKILLEDENLNAVLDEGLYKFFTRFYAPIWMSEVFECKNIGSVIRPNYVMQVKLEVPVITEWKSVAVSLSKIVLEIVKRAGVVVYQNNAVYVHSSSQLTQQQALNLVRFNGLPKTSAEMLALFQHLQDTAIAISRSESKELLQEVSQMSVRDMVSLALTHRPKLVKFFKELERQMDEGAKKRLDSFFKSQAPSLDPNPQTPKEDALGTSLTARLKEIRSKIRAANEKLEQFTSYLDRSLQGLMLEEHYKEVFRMINVLSTELELTDNRENIVSEASMFVKVVAEIQNEKIQYKILSEMAASPLGHCRILSKDAIFEKVLKREIGIQDGQRSDCHSLSQHQMDALFKLCNIYEFEGRNEEAADLYVMAENWKPNTRLTGQCLSQYKLPQKRKSVTDEVSGAGDQSGEDVWFTGLNKLDRPQWQRLCVMTVNCSDEERTNIAKAVSSIEDSRKESYIRWPIALNELSKLQLSIKEKDFVLRFYNNSKPLKQAWNIKKKK